MLRDLIGHFPADGFESTSMIMEAHPCIPVDQLVHKIGGNSPGKTILSSHPPSTHHTITLQDLVHQDGNLGGVALKVHVKAHQNIASRFLQSRGQGGMLAKISSQTDSMDTDEFLRYGMDLFKRIIVASIVNENHLVLLEAGGKDLHDLPAGMPHQGSTIPYRNHNRNEYITLDH